MIALAILLLLAIATNVATFWRLVSERELRERANGELSRLRALTGCRIKFPTAVGSRQWLAIQVREALLQRLPLGIDVRVQSEDTSEVEAGVVAVLVRTPKARRGAA